MEIQERIMRNLRTLMLSLVKARAAGSIEPLYEFKEWLREICSYDLASLVKEPNLLSLIFVLEAFFGKLQKRFGVGTQGVPVKEGQPFMENICRAVAEFIIHALDCIHNQPAEFTGLDPFKSIAKMMEAYSGLCQCRADLIERYNWQLQEIEWRDF